MVKEGDVGSYFFLFSFIEGLCFVVCFFSLEICIRYSGKFIVIGSRFRFLAFVFVL